MIVFKKTYDGESLYDIERDIVEAFDTDFNPIVKNIPQDEYGILEGTFTVKIEWQNDD